MRRSSVEWTEKYRPKNLREIAGNETAVEELTVWAKEIFKPRSKKAAVLHGPAGCGKTSAAYAVAAENGWEVIELNASDQRSADVIKRIVGPASTCNTFTQTTRLIILDEADNLHGNEDRGGTKAITEIVKRSAQPIILTANEKYKMEQGLLRNCKIITFQRIKPGTVFSVLKRIAEDAEIEIPDSTLIYLAKNARGDLRSAVNDLQALSISTSISIPTSIPEEEIVTGRRDIMPDIFAVLKLIFGAEGYGLQNAITALYRLDKTPEESIQWIYKNFSYEYDQESFLHGLQYLSRADMFLGRVRQRENYKFWRYASSLMVCSVLSAKEMQASKSRNGGRGRGWEREERRERHFRSPWQRAKIRDGEVERKEQEEKRKSRAVQEVLAAKIATCCKVPQRYASSFLSHFLPIFFSDERKAEEITASLRLDPAQIAFLLGDTGIGTGTSKAWKEKVKKIYQAAVERTRGSIEEAGQEQEQEQKQKQKRVRVTEVMEDERMETITSEDKDELEVKDQRTLTDFF